MLYKAYSKLIINIKNVGYFIPVINFEYWWLVVVFLGICNGFNKSTTLEYFFILVISFTK